METSSKFLKSIRGRYKKSKDKIARLYNADAPEDDETIIKDLEALKKCQEILKKIRST